MGLLVDGGVEPVEATRRVCSAVKPAKQRTGWELFGRGERSDAANLVKGLNVAGLRVRDVRSHRPGGGTWDFTKSYDRAWAKRLVGSEDPGLIVTATPYALR